MDFLEDLFENFFDRRNRRAIGAARSARRKAHRRWKEPPDLREFVVGRRRPRSEGEPTTIHALDRAKDDRPQRGRRTKAVGDVGAHLEHRTG